MVVELDVDWIDSWQLRSREDVHPSHELQVVTIKSLKEYLKIFDNLDEVECGCGCNRMIPVPHGFIDVIRKALKIKER